MGGGAWRVALLAPWLVCNLSLLTNDSKLRDLCWFCFYLFCCCSIEMSHSMCIIVQSIINVSAAMGRGGHKYCGIGPERAVMIRTL